MARAGWRLSGHQPPQQGTSQLGMSSRRLTWADFQAASWGPRELGIGIHRFRRASLVIWIIWIVGSVLLPSLTLPYLLERGAQEGIPYGCQIMLISWWGVGTRWSRN